MPPIMNGERIDAYTSLRDSAIAVLGNRAVVDALGTATASALHERIASSYCLEVAPDQSIRVPEEEVRKDNLGVLVLLPEDVPAVINPAPYFASLTPEHLQKAYSAGGSRAGFESLVEAMDCSFASSRTVDVRHNSVAFHWNKAMVHVASPEDSPSIFQSRRLMVLNGNNASTPVPFIHETHHDIFSKQLAEQHPELYLTEKAMRIKRTWLEREAYRIGSTILQAIGQIETVDRPEANAVLAQIWDPQEPQEPHDMASEQSKLNYQMAALDAVLGRPQGMPQPIEVNWYRNYKVI